ncbi:hypothetical protein MPTK1_6g19200 [Marchantia polymorpha subsp. ruderalis]|uniref:Reticulon domain-containing protein n=2 Tax=Marchantia polymorpha TaxID=3197 RepID=A0AAF6BTQ2_MARPO|nr:hypothetical protein MARPO_0045s0143 [Marchantia polymorpha]BBN15386.1 hypothetical protein Mp_6g19200 [Marchantia polymorpha subsp. ruderalis]|eukprot:PTQ39500.1 hypothetical protein MARPO_0045s0143 [Marchantia polymorpha]
MTEKIVICERAMSRKPRHTFLLLCCGSLVWYYCGPQQRNVVSLFADILFTLVCALGLLGYICRQLNLAIPVDPLEWQVTPEVANDVAACVANTVGAAEGVLRVAASGRDSKLFTKVVLVLYLISAIGRSASGATVAYFALCFAMIVPYCVSKIAPEITAHTPTFLQKRFNSLTGSLTPDWTE